MEWHTRVRNYKQEIGRIRKVDCGTEHPLKPFVVNSSRQASTESPLNSKAKEPTKSAQTSWGGVDPLSAAMNQIKLDVEEDPFTAYKPKTQRTSIFTLNEDFYDWPSRKVSILNKYTTSEKLSLKSSFLTGGKAVGVRAVQSASVADKVKHRLEQLDEFEEGSVREMLNLSQQEFVSRIEELNAALQDSWDQDQRVKALKIAIQCAKMLDDSTVIQFYPSKFVLVTDILDNFGNLVFSRISGKSKGIASEVAQETCRNWFFKIASIRELIPRFYVETCILKTYEFIVDESERQAGFTHALNRLTKMVRGIGDPLMATFARAYLCRISLQVVPQEKSIILANYSDFFLGCSQFRSSYVENTIRSQKLSLSVYLSFFVPALDWILHCLCFDAPDKLMIDVLNELNQKTSTEKDSVIFSLVLNSILTSFKPSFVVNRSNEFLKMVKSCTSANTDSNLPSHLLIQSLGASFVAGQSVWENVDSNEKLVLLNDVWRIIGKLPTCDYMVCADVWIEFVVLNFGTREINTLLKDIIKHLSPGRSFEDHYDNLLSITKKLTKINGEEFGALFAMDSFMPFIDMYQKESVKLEACKIILTNFFEQQTKTSDSNLLVTDPVIINALMQMCKALHDSVNAISLEDERRQISSLVVSTLNLVSFREDLEAHLNFLVDSRGNFPNLEAVIIFLVHSVNKLTLETHKLAKHQTKKTTAFLRACLSYAYITIPSLEDDLIRLQLYLSCAEIALHSACLPQTDAFLKAAITLLPQLPHRVELGDGRVASNDAFFASYVRNLLSFILVVPDHPEQEPLYLFRGLFNVIRERDFDAGSDAKTLLYMDMLAFLSSAEQETYIYHVGNVDSNDTLYGNEENFMQAIKTLNNEIVELILSDLTTLGEDKLFKKQANLALEAFYRVVTYGDARQMAKFAIKLWNLAQKTQTLDPKQQMQAVNYVKKKRLSSNDSVYEDLATRMQLTKRL